MSMPTEQASSKPYIRTVHTLRDMSQSVELLGMGADVMIRILRLHQELGYDMEELGFAGANPRFMQAFQYVRDHPEEFCNIGVAVFGCTRKPNKRVQEDGSISAIAASGMSVVNLVAKAHARQVETVLRTTPEENVRMLQDSVRHLLSLPHVREVNVDLEHFFDGMGADEEYALSMVAAARDAGARDVVLCDTNGGGFPETIGAVVRKVKDIFPSVPLGIHAHNDGDLAVANTLAAVDNGATHVQVTHDHFGERGGGNADAESVIGNLARKKYGVLRPNGDLRRLTSIAARVSQLLGKEIARNKPFTGPNAPRHVAGMHSCAELREEGSYTFMDLAAVGNVSANSLPISDLAGTAARQNFVGRATTIDDQTRRILLERMEVLEELVDLDALRGVVHSESEASLLLAFLRKLELIHPRFEVLGTSVNNTHKHGATATVTIRLNGDTKAEEVTASGNGYYDAMNHAFREALGERFPVVKKLHLLDFKTRKLPTSDEDSASTMQVIIDFTDGEEVFSTSGVSDNVIDASEYALADACHYLIMKDDLTPNPNPNPNPYPFGFRSTISRPTN